MTVITVSTVGFKEDDIQMRLISPSPGMTIESGDAPIPLGEPAAIENLELIASSRAGHV